MSKKRGAGEGTIRKLPSGRWSWVRMIGRDQNGKVIYDRVTADTQQKLLKAVEEHKQAKASELSKATVPTFKEFATSWYNRYQENLRVSTRTSYRHTLQKILVYWGETPIDQIRASAITDMLQSFSEANLSASYIKKLRSMLYQIMDSAEADELITRNPVRYVKNRPNTTNQEKPAFTSQEIRLITALKPGKLRDFVILALATGMRTQELLALRGNDISEDGSTISITRAVNMAGNIPTIGLTKSPSSIRTIPVPATVQHIAAKYHSYGDTLIWQSPQKPDRPINPSTYRAAFTRLCKAAGVRTLTPHCCRHTYVTQLHAHGVDMTTIKALAGHSRRDVTEGYLHISQEALATAANKLNDLFEGITSDSIG